MRGFNKIALVYQMDYSEGCGGLIKSTRCIRWITVRDAGFNKIARCIRWITVRDAGFNKIALVYQIDYSGGCGV